MIRLSVDFITQVGNATNKTELIFSKENKEMHT